jgi:hypothetical protein
MAEVRAEMQTHVDRRIVLGSAQQFPTEIEARAAAA